MNTEAATALVILLAIGAVLLLLFWAYPRLTVDAYRQSIFELRDELFRFAAGGGICFDNAAYGMLRSTLNGHIRFAHHWRLSSMILAGLLWPRSDSEAFYEVQTRWTERMAELSADQRRVLASIEGRMKSATLRHLLVRSPVATLIVVPPVVLVAIFKVSLTILVRKINDRTTATAYAVGHPA